MADHLNSDESALDRVSGSVTLALSERSTRAAFLAKVGKALLLVTGGAAAGVAIPLAMDRRIAHADHCNAWQMCGVCGYLCAHCGGSDSSCPGSCTTDSSWWGCCQSFDGCSYYVQYIDCCGSCSTCPDSAYCCHASVSNWCSNWPDPSAAYRCTLVLVGNGCVPGC